MSLDKPVDVVGDVNRPLLVFPCPNYPIKILGDAFEGYTAAVLAVVEKHAQLSGAPLPLKPSRNGRFVSLTVNIIATGEPQLRVINDELRALSYIKMVM